MDTNLFEYSIQNVSNQVRGCKSLDFLLCQNQIDITMECDVIRNALIEYYKVLFGQMY